MRFISMKVAAGGRNAMDVDQDELREALSAAADLLLPLAEQVQWDCMPEIVAWLVAVRHTYGVGLRQGSLH